MGTIYISIILLCRIAQHICSKKTSNTISGALCFVQYCSYTNILSGVLGLLLILIAHNGFSYNLTTFLISAFSGLMIAASTGFSLAAMKSGTVALTSLFSTAGILVPCIAGIFLFGQPMSRGQWGGIALFFVAAYLLIESSAKMRSGFSFKTLILLIGTMLANGFTMLAQQMFTFCVPDGDVSMFSFLSFGIVGVLMFILSCIPAKGESKIQYHLSSKLLVLGAVSAVAVFIINQLATMSTALVPPAILFAFINGGSTIIAAIVAAICFHEKLTMRSVMGITIGVIALIIIKAF
ncbi:MAG: hypothetical protein ACI4DY_12340 [Monoglobaceae bacterium]